MEAQPVRGVHCSEVNRKVVIGSFGGYAYALWRATGEQAWKFKSVGHRFFPAGEMQGNPAAANGLVYVGTPEGYIEVLHRLGAIFSTPVIAGGRMYVSSTDGRVYCLVRNTSEYEFGGWRLQLNNRRIMPC